MMPICRNIMELSIINVEVDTLSSTATSFIKTTCNNCGKSRDHAVPYKLGEPWDVAIHRYDAYKHCPCPLVID